MRGNRRDLARSFAWRSKNSHDFNDRAMSFSHQQSAPTFSAGALELLAPTFTAGVLELLAAAGPASGDSGHMLSRLAF